ncbi:MAG: class I SAM-dependent methyltransferase [Desulfovibrio sp.]|jgi:16S rRNA (guanine527-N7)-methyltransferase|nr:class I SAM-dependent methyltransferase [Desulfovibrio sp.]
MTKMPPPPAGIRATPAPVAARQAPVRFGGARQGPSTPAPDTIRAVAEAMGFALADKVHLLLSDYLGLLAKWSRTANLTGPRDPLDILRFLVVDSLYLADYLGGLHLPPAPFCADLGAGAGLPGLPLRMLRAEGDYMLIEAREKRAQFMRAFLAVHPLPGTRVYHGRAEAFLHCSAHPDLIVSRAFMPADKLLAFVGKHAPETGVCILFTRGLPAEKTTKLLNTGWTPASPMGYKVGEDRRFLQAVLKT